MAAEVLVYDDANIQISNLRATLHGKTYAMANVTSVSVFTQTKSKLPGILLLVLGVVLAPLGLAGNDEPGCFVVAAIVLISTGFASAVAARDVYWMRIGSASGEANALSSRDADYIARIVAAMNEAIVLRG